MSNHSGANSSRNYALQPSDHAGQHAQHCFVRYDTERDANANGASSTPVQSHMQNLIPNYPAFQTPDSPRGQLPASGFHSGAQLTWDWTGSIDFPEFLNHCGPQGDLLQEPRSQNVSANDCNRTPLASTSELGHQSSHQPQSAIPGSQNPLSPPPRPPQRPAVQTSMKRKAESELSPAVSQSARVTTENRSKRPNQSRTSSTASTPAASLDAPMSQITVASAAAEHASQSASKAHRDGQRQRELTKGTGLHGKVIDVSKSRKVVESSGSTDMLPAGEVFSIQIGSELFRLSGASISSDAPSYFSHFFDEQLHNNEGRAGDVRTLYIDRDPETFRDIALHLQGYHITPRNGEHFVKLFADAQFYSLPRLTKQLFKTDIFVRIGGTPFQIPRDLFSAPGNSPNYFSLGFAQFFSTPSEVFPGLDRSALLRPPSISPPSVPNKSGDTFAELIKMLQGYKVEIRNDTHRSQLLRDARYFHLRGLEQQLIPCEVSYNLNRQQSEILIRLEDIRQSGVSFTPDATPDHKAQSVPPSPASSATLQSGHVSYTRPYIDDPPHPSILVLELSSPESTTLLLPQSAPLIRKDQPVFLSLQATFHNTALARITSLFSVIASKMGLPATHYLGLMHIQIGSGVSEQCVRVRLDSDCAIELDGKAVEVGPDEEGRTEIRQVDGKKWVWGGARLESVGEEKKQAEWVVQRAHWRLRVERLACEAEGEENKMQILLCGTRIEAYTVERTRNLARGFLGSK